MDRLNRTVRWSVIPVSLPTGPSLDAQLRSDAASGNERGDAAVADADMVDDASADATETGATGDADLEPDAGQVADAAGPNPDVLPDVDASTPQDAEAPVTDAAVDAMVPPIVDAELADVELPVPDAEPVDAAPSIADAALEPDAQHLDDAALPEDDAYPGGPYGLEPGDVITDLRFVDSDDTPYQLSDVRQEPNTRLMVLPVIALWCPVCVRKVPAMGAVQMRFRDAGVRLTLTVYQGRNARPATARDVAQFSREQDPPFEVVADPERVMAPYFDVFARDKYLLIDADTMRIVHASERLEIDELERRIDAWVTANP